MFESDTDSDYSFLRIGALLHDIGHIVPDLDGEAKGHAERGFEFLSSFESTELFSAFAKYHHAQSVDEIKEEGLDQKYKNLILMVRKLLGFLQVPMKVTEKIPMVSICCNPFFKYFKYQRRCQNPRA